MSSHDVEQAERKALHPTELPDAHRRVLQPSHKDIAVREITADHGRCFDDVRQLDQRLSGCFRPVPNIITLLSAYRRRLLSAKPHSTCSWASCGTQRFLLDVATIRSVTGSTAR